MSKINIEKVKSLASDLMFNISDETASEIEENSENYFYYLDLLNAVDTKGVDALSYPFEDTFPTLREDVVDHVIDQSLALENAPKTEGEYIEVVQVINK